MTASALVARLALAAAFAAGAVACKKEAEPAKAASSESGGGDTSQAGVETSADSTKRGAQLPAKPRKLPGGELADPQGEERRRRWGDRPRPDRAEMRAKRDERRKDALAMYDVDKNGELDDDERGVMHEARVADMLARMDQNADGKLTREELDASATNRRRPPPDFETIDTNKDGFVTLEEMAAARPPRNFRDRRDQLPPPAPNPPPQSP